jgi:hypothetical protein
MEASGKWTSDRCKPAASLKRQYAEMAASAVHGEMSRAGAMGRDSREQGSVSNAYVAHAQSNR